MPELLALPKSETSQSQPVDSSPICHAVNRVKCGTLSSAEFFDPTPKCSSEKRVSERWPWATTKAGEDFSARWRQQQFPTRCLRSPADTLTQVRSPKPRRGRRIADAPRCKLPTRRRVSQRPRDTPRVEADTSRPLAIKQHHPTACRI
jgi:hypothetical protein